MIRILLLCLGALIIPPGAAEELEQGRLYAGGTELTSQSLGIRFTLPPGWQGGSPPGSELFILESAQLSARILLYMDEGTLGEMREQASQPIQLDWQTTLTPKGTPTEADGILRAEFAVSQQNVEASVLGREARPGLLITATTLSQAGQFAAAETFARGIVEDFNATPPPAPQTVASPGGWDAVLRGAHLLRLYTGSGYSEEEHIYLCSDGSFHRSNNSGGFGNGASGASGAQGLGRWRSEGDPATGGTLFLVYGAGTVSSISGPGFDQRRTEAGGETVTFSLHFDGKKLMVNNRRWFRDTNNFCQ